MTTQVDVDTVVAGAGVVGLAAARALAQSGREVFVLEACERAGEGISSRNSGVIHAGFYYEPASLKARCCVRGVQLLYEFCARRGVGHRRTGKLVVATHEEELPKLEKLLQRAAANGVRASAIDAAHARRLEPALNCVAALDSPDSGIVDVPELVMALAGELEQANGKLVCNVRVGAVHRDGEVLIVDTGEGGTIRCRRFVNAAGLDAVELAHAIEGLDAHHVPKQFYGQGHYYNIRGRSPFSRLIYPLPHHTGLGVHLGIDISGRCRFGPDVRYIDAPDYRFDDSQRAAFADSIRRWWPPLKDEDLTPDFVGVRPKLAGPHEPSADFVVQGPAVHGIPGLVNLFGIESPGLTSSLALGEEVARVLTETG